MNLSVLRRPPTFPLRVMPLGLALRLSFVFLGAVFSSVAQGQAPAVGQVAPDFTQETTSGQAVRLSAQTDKGTTVLIFLRGYPGYQCPFCQKQAHDFIAHAADFAAKKASVLLVYPGPPAELDQHAKEFLAKQAALPSNIVLVTDPNYKATNLYGLRWDAPNETAYPSTFILDRSRKVLFQKISRSHGDRTTASEILESVPSPK
ncbi:MAG: peroxiredoxin family protein [Candidatus Acidiferrum sp.]